MKKPPGSIWRPLVGLAVFGMSTFAYRWLLRDFELSTAARVAVALLPLAGAVFFLVMQVQGIRRMDELYQRIQFEALVSALVVTFLALIFVKSFQRADLLIWDFDDVWPYAFMLGYVLGYMIAMRRYHFFQ